MTKSKSGWCWLLVVVAVYGLLAGYKLRELPGEWFGDISIVHEEVVDILKNPLDWKFNLSAGPLYHHLVAGLAYFLGATYGTYKTASVLTGLLGLVMIYLMAWELAGRRVALWTIAVAAGSFWYLVWARLGSSPQILSPVLTAATVYFLARYARTGKWLDMTISMLAACSGLFSYPALFILPAVPWVIIVWQLIRQKDKGRWRRALMITGLISVLMGGWFVRTVKAQPDLFNRGYIGEKVFSQTGSWMLTAGKMSQSLLKTLMMFHVRGDSGFRINVPKAPQLDRLSGLLMIIGLLWLLADPRWRAKRIYILVPMCLLLIPSISPGIPEAEIPSAGRTFGVVPWVFLLVGMGLEWIVKRLGRWVPAGALGLVGMILVLNVYQYFGAYARGLPNHNQPWGWQIAQYIDSLPAETAVKLTDCCWGEWGQPEPKGIYYVLQNQTGRHNIVTDYPFVSRCEELAGRNSYVLIFRPDRSQLIDRFRGCYPEAAVKLHRDALDQTGFYSLEVKGN